MSAVPTELIAGALSALLGLASAAYKRQARREDRVDRRLSALERAIARIEARLGIDTREESEPPSDG